MLYFITIIECNFTHITLYFRMTFVNMFMIMAQQKNLMNIILNESHQATINFI